MAEDALRPDDTPEEEGGTTVWARVLDHDLTHSFLKSKITVAAGPAGRRGVGAQCALAPAVLTIVEHLAARAPP